MGNSKPENALCHILCQTDASLAEGVGVFTAPNTILTARHVVLGGTNITATNAKGEQTRAVSYVLPADDRIDAALVSLSEPIGRSVCPVARARPAGFQPENSGQLVTLFNNQRKTHPVTLCQKFDSSSGTARFFANIPVEPGYSGSPIVDRRGRIFSLVTDSTSMGDQTQKKPLLGVQPQALLSFLSGQQAVRHFKI